MPWQKLGDRTMRQVGCYNIWANNLYLCSLQVSVGGCGMWGVAKDNSLWFRVGTAGRTGEWAGDNWTKVFLHDEHLDEEPDVDPDEGFEGFVDDFDQ